MQLEKKLVDPMRNYAQEMSGGTKSSPEEGHDGDIQEDIDFMTVLTPGTCPHSSKSLFVWKRAILLSTLFSRKETEEYCYGFFFCVF